MPWKIAEKNPASSVTSHDVTSDKYCISIVNERLGKCNRRKLRSQAYPWLRRTDPDAPAIRICDRRGYHLPPEPCVF